MKGKIDVHGALWMKRGSEYKEQLCVFNLNNPEDGGAKSCGDLCPQFGEPNKVKSEDANNTYLNICQGRLLKFDEFKDER